MHFKKVNVPVVTAPVCDVPSDKEATLAPRSCTREGHGQLPVPWPALCPFVTYWIGPYSSIIIALGTYQLMRFALASEGLGLAPAVAGYRTRDQLAPPSTVRIAPVV